MDEHVATLAKNIKELDRQAKQVWNLLKLQDSDSDEDEEQNEGSKHALRKQWINLECALRILQRRRVQYWIKQVDFVPGPLDHIYRPGERVCMCLMAMPDMPTKVEGHVIGKDPQDMSRLIVWFDGTLHSTPPAALCPLDMKDMLKRAASVRFISSSIDYEFKADEKVQIFEPFPCENNHQPWIKMGVVESLFCPQIYRVNCPDLDASIYVYRHNLAPLNKSK